MPPWLLVVPVIGFLILVHELGHFATAKWFGVKVTEFGFGFPPRIFGIRFGETIYSINWIPLGGFVKMVGEEDPSDERSFARLSVLRRGIVLSAGSFVNLMVPVAIFTILFMLPHDTLVGGEVVVRAVAPGSPAQEAGLRAGDTILTVDGQRVLTPDELKEAIRKRLGRPVELGIRRAPVIGGLGSSSELASFSMVTLVPRLDPPRLRVVEVVTDPSTQVSLAEARRYDPSLKVGDTLAQKWIGVVMGLTNPKFGKTTDPIWIAVPNSTETIRDILVFTWRGIADGISSGTNPGIAGPIGIAQATGEVVSRLGFATIFQLTAVLSISLGIVNMLPIPALDGGRLMFVVIEWVRRGKRISPRREGLVHLVGFVIVVGFIVFMSYFDILRLLNGESILP